MASQPAPDALRIRVLRDSPAGENGVFVVAVRCGDPLLLRFWSSGGRPWSNGEAEQAGVSWQADGRGLSFMLRAVHRAADRADEDYWGPFVLALCLDALHFRFCLPPALLSGGDVTGLVGGGGELVLYR